MILLGGSRFCVRPTDFYCKNSEELIILIVAPTKFFHTKKTELKGLITCYFTIWNNNNAEAKM